MSSTPMAKPSVAHSKIVVVGARENNLKNVSVEIPQGT